MSEMDHPLVSRLSDCLLPEFHLVAEVLRREFPDVQINVYDGPAGSATEFQGHSFFIDCLLNEPLEEADNVALSLEVRNFRTEPRLHADVCWGHPSGCFEADWPEEWATYNEWPLATDENIHELRKALPTLYDGLKRALSRRRPRHDK